ncbi:FAS1 domain-containing protein [Zopfia rhizophila CBS 207.26]|uniref:FAS1 domain-containing protein n=1 Tax=Zopfia rhizophila CBS 207.26 TaxID=1314779 RepID=A0A6A6EK88_9PEZI|nr:FAS1 domain-containing protein [Zopfia rhizophila CBS 207.26]
MISVTRSACLPISFARRPATQLHFSAALGAGAAAEEANNTPNVTLARNDQVSNLTSFLNAENITILTPSNEAFAKLTNSSAGEAPTNDSDLVNALLVFIPTLLTNESYTNVTGGQILEAVRIGSKTVFFSGLLHNASVTEADLNFIGGVIYIVDTVLTLPLNVSDTALTVNLTSIRSALNFTDLTDAVNESPDLTIFAPYNDAFQSIGSALASLSESDLADILAYHVINGTVAYSSDLENGSSVETVNGANSTITIDANGTVFVDSAKVVTPNVLIANGVVHIIDKRSPEPSAKPGVPGFTSASSATDVPFTSGQSTPTTTSEDAGPASTAVPSSTTGAAVSVKTGAVGAAALFCGVAVLLNYQFAMDRKLIMNVVRE